MSKRFGRNQRRRMREQIADLEQTVRANQVACSREFDRRMALEQRLCRWADEVRRMLGNHSAYNEQLSRMAWRGEGRGPIHLPPAPAPMQLAARYAQMSTADFAAVCIQAFIWMLEVKPDLIEPRYYVILEQLDRADRRLYFAVDDAMLRRPTDRMVEEFAISIARQFRDALERVSR